MNDLYSRNFAVSFFSQTLFVTGNMMLINYALWIGFLGGDERDIGLVMGLAPVAGLLLRPWIGQWIERIGARLGTATGATIVGLAAAMNFGVTTLGPAVYLSRTFMVIGAAIFFASSLTYITQTTPPERRTEAIGLLGCGGFVGMILGPLIGDRLMHHAGDRTTTDFFWLFTTATVTIAAAVLLLTTLRKPADVTTHGNATLRDFLHTAKRHWPGIILWVNVVFGVCMTVPFAFLPKFVDRIGVGGIGTYFLIYAGWGLFLRLSLRRIPDRFGRKSMLLAGMLCMGVGSLLYLFVDSAHPSRLLIAAFVSGSGHSLIFHTMIALTLEPFPVSNHGTGTVLAYAAMDIGTIGSAPILGYMAHHWGYASIFWSVGILCFATTVGCAFVSENKRRARQVAKQTVENHVPRVCPVGGNSG